MVLRRMGSSRVRTIACSLLPVGPARPAPGEYWSERRFSQYLSAALASYRLNPAVGSHCFRALPLCQRISGYFDMSFMATREGAAMRIAAVMRCWLSPTSISLGSLYRSEFLFVLGMKGGR